MKLDILRKIIREEVKGAIQEELKDLLLEAIRIPKQPVINEGFNKTQLPSGGFGTPNSIPSPTKDQLRESYRNILGETAASFNTSQVGKPLQLTGVMDTASPNGKLPEGEVPMDMIVGLLKSR